MNVVFDLGGVVVRWEPRALVARTFADPAQHELALAGIVGHPDWVELDRGTLAPETAIARAVARTGLTPDDVAEFHRRVPASLLPIPGTVELLYRLRSRGHALYCLSNMQVASIEHLENRYDFWEVFSGRVISCRLHLCKPEPDIYAHLLSAFGLDAADTVFIDDVEANLAAAAQFGIGTIHFDNPAQCADELRRRGCI